MSGEPGPSNLPLASDENLRLYVHVIGLRTSSFPVFISRSKTVGELKEAILEKKQKELIGVEPDRLILYKVALPDGKNLEELELALVAEKEKLGVPARRLSRVFLVKPPPKMVSIILDIKDIVFFSLDSVLGKRPRAPDELDSARKSKLIRHAPSQISKLSNYWNLQQEPFQKILDDRPESDSIPPISLLYDGFGHFQDIFGEKIYDLGKEQQDLVKAVESFAEEMTKIYSSETDRTNVGLRCLNKIFRGHKDLVAGSIGSASHFDGPHGAASFVVEFKNESCDFTSIPMVELVSYAARLAIGDDDNASNLCTKVFKAWRVPCLGLTVVGPQVTFFAIMFLGQWRIVRLTPNLSCVPSACDGLDRIALYAAFSAAQDLLNRINEDAKRIMDTPPTNEHLNYKLPYISSLPSYDTPNHEIKFKILERHPHHEGYRHLYFAETLDKKRILVKFARKYSIELHAFCADRGRAPSIIGFQSIPGGWSVVAMEHISEAANPSKSTHLTRLYDQWANDLQELVNSFHGEGLVHGDLREPNIICDEEEVMLLDFDWGGKLGEACYPYAALCDELTNGRVNSSAKITKEDDLRILQNTLRHLKSCHDNQKSSRVG